MIYVLKEDYKLIGMKRFILDNVINFSSRNWFEEDC